MDKLNKRLVFYGGGKMAEGIIRGLIKNGKVDPVNIAVQEQIQDRCTYLHEKYGVDAKTDAEIDIREADMVLIGVNPPQVPSVTEALKPILNKDTVVLSYACGVTISSYADQLGDDKKLARIVPNTLSLYGNGYSAVLFNEKLNDADREFVDSLVRGLGKVIYLDESKFNDFQSYSCTGPFWIYKFAEAMIDAGIYVGFNRAEARNLLLENLLGVAKHLQESGMSPTAIIEDLTSPGGITIEAVRTLQENGGYSVPTIASVDAAVKKCTVIAER